MDKKEKIELQKYKIDRYDHYYDAVNNKGNVYLSLFIFLTGGSITAFFALNEKNSLSMECWFIMCISSLMGIAGIVTTLFAIKPFLGKCK